MIPFIKRILKGGVNFESFGAFFNTFIVYGVILYVLYLVVQALKIYIKKNK